LRKGTSKHHQPTTKRRKLYLWIYHRKGEKTFAKGGVRRWGGWGRGGGSTGGRPLRAKGWFSNKMLAEGGPSRGVEEKAGDPKNTIQNQRRQKGSWDWHAPLFCKKKQVRGKLTGRRRVEQEQGKEKGDGKKRELVQS